MSFSLMPRQMCRSIYHLDLDALKERGIRVLFADLDNTLARYREKDPSEPLRLWKQGLEAAGIRVFIISNGRRPNRSGRFAQGLEVDYISHAGKPRAAAFHRALEQTGCPPEQALMVGDQIFTDIWGAHNGGVTAVLVRPVALDSWFRRLRYGVETPFRALCPNKEGF